MGNCWGFFIARYLSRLYSQPMKKHNLLQFTKDELTKYRGAWPWIAERAGVSYSFITHMMQGTRTRLYIDSLQKLADTLVDIANGDLPIPGVELDKILSKVGGKSTARRKPKKVH